MGSSVNAFEFVVNNVYGLVFMNIKIFFVFRFRFHFCQALYRKIKNKFKLAGFVRPTGKAEHQAISFVLRQYFALPLLRPEDMRGEVRRLEEEMKCASARATPEIRKRLNLFHNYVINYWMRLLGPETISVAGVDHKTNNVTER